MTAAANLLDQPKVFRGFATALIDVLAEAIAAVAEQAPLRIMEVPGGRMMSVAITNAGQVGWVSDRRGYRYSPIDPLTGRAWPPMPEPMHGLAVAAARQAGFDGFNPDACLLNRYQPGARLSLHQDRNERDFAHPIVSVSLGLPAIFLFGGAGRGDPVRRIPLVSGDVVVWGGPTRLAFHGVAPLKDGADPRFGRCRYNLTLRRAL